MPVPNGNHLWFLFGILSMNDFYPRKSVIYVFQKQKHYQHFVIRKTLLCLQYRCGFFCKIRNSIADFMIIPANILRFFS